MSSFLHWFRRLGIPLTGLLFFVALSIVYPDSDPTNPPWGSANGETLAALGLGVLLSYLTFEIGILLSRGLDRRLPWHQRPLRRVGLQVSLQTALALAVTWVAAEVYVRLGGYDTLTSPVHLADLLPLLLVGLFTAFLLSGAYIGASFFNYWQAEVLARETAERQALTAQVQALQQQLDPHFLFNTLNTLTAVIEDDPPRAVTFVQRLATVYRYVLQHRHAARVALRDELRLAAAYLYLLQTRYPAGLRVQVDVPEAQQSGQVLPLVLQLLLENAVKHNRIEPDAPLSIRIFTEAGWLVVENNRQPLPHPPASTGLGLENVRRRYAAAGAPAPVRVESSAEWFRVCIPLLGGGGEATLLLR